MSTMTRADAARYANHIRLAHTDQEALNAHAARMREGLRAKWEREVVERDGPQTPEELARKVEHLRQAHYIKMTAARKGRRAK